MKKLLFLIFICSLSSSQYGMENKRIEQDSQKPASLQQKTLDAFWAGRIKEFQQLLTQSKPTTVPTTVEQEYNLLAYQSFLERLKIQTNSLPVEDTVKKNMFNIIEQNTITDQALLNKIQEIEEETALSEEEYKKKLELIQAQYDKLYLSNKNS